jgi:hypothetical protein
VEDGLAAVYGPDGRRQPREGEIGPALVAEHAEGYEEGRAEGRVEAKRDMVRRLVQARFGTATTLEQRIDAAGEHELDELLDRVLTATSPGDI